MTNIREGYKETEIGAIPKDWEVVVLGSLVVLIDGDRGNNYPSPNEIVDQGVLFLSTSNIIDNKLDLSNTKFITKEKFDCLRKGKLEQKDIVITLRGTLGSCMVFESDMYETAFINAQMMIIRPNRTIAKHEFLYRTLVSDIIKKQIESTSTGSAQPQLTKKTIKEFKLPLPSLKEQEKIAEIFSTTDNHIEKLDRLIEDYEIFKKGMMQKLLTEGIGHTEFKNTEIGRIPIEWEIKKLEYIADVKGGKRLPKGYSLQDEPNGHPYIRVADMYKGGINSHEIKYVPEDIANAINKYLISKDDIYISVAGTLGIVGKVPERLNRANLTENADKICNIKCYRDYLMYYLQSERIQKLISNEMTIGAQPKLALSRIKKFDIVLPSEREQKSISQYISDLGNNLELLLKQKEDYTNLKKALMDRLLTGKIRVV